MPQSNATKSKAGAERRRWNRHEIAADTTVTAKVAGRDYPCRVDDLCFGGVKLQFLEEAPDVDELEVVHPRAGSFKARCMWQSGNFLGIEFVVAESELEHVLQCLSLSLHPDQK
ncbi:MAG: PilZ domain-containing protein [Kiloniellales bacterium]